MRRAMAPEQRQANQTSSQLPENDQFRLETEVLKANSGVAVMLMLPPELAKKLAIDGGEPASDLHVTLAYLGKAADLSESQRNAAKEVMGKFAEQYCCLIGSISGVGRFSSNPTTGGNDVFYLTYDSACLPDFRQALVHMLKDAGLPVQEVHGYTPHITLKYIDPNEAMPYDKFVPVELNFEQVTLGIGEDRSNYKLVGDASGPIDPDSYLEDIEAGPNNYTSKIRKAGEVSGQGTLIVLGSGPGRSLEILKEQYKLDVSGVDSVAHSITKSREKGLVCYLHDPQETPFKDGTYAKSLSIDLLHRVYEPAKLLREGMRLAVEKSIHIVPLGATKHKQVRMWKTAADLAMWLDGPGGLAGVQKSVVALPLDGKESAALIVIDKPVVTPEKNDVEKNVTTTDVLADSGKMYPEQGKVKLSIHDELTQLWRFHLGQSIAAKEGANKLPEGSTTRQMLEALSKESDNLAAEVKKSMDAEEAKQKVEELQEVTKNFTGTIVKADLTGEKRLVYGVVLKPNVTDLQGDIISAEEIEKAAHNFVANYNKVSKIGYQHKEFDRQLELVESWIAPSDLDYYGKLVKKGTWLVTVRVLDNEIWERVKKGLVKGFSIGGKAKVRRLAA